MTDPWQQLRRLTTARIALGRTGGSLPTREVLDLRLAHARARDAVLAPFAAAAFADQIRLHGAEVLAVESAATTQAEFLLRPDLGRQLAPASRNLLAHRAAETSNATHDLVIIVSEGLSSLAVHAQAPPLLAALLPLVKQSGWKLAPLIVVSHGRVALQDEIGSLLCARLSLMLLGERPGLSAADSLGAYLTYNPHPGLTDAARNCISNIRSAGLSPVEAAAKLHYLLTQSLQRGLSGVELKDDSSALPAQPLRPVIASS